ncbi:hypothetical protein BaRGS_00007002 [Batillaria attramentaria]|uniref:Uncharacterized protein n=1 Tax=Batillaria attramentaria TaxID=370345 RepID=A0ABD0LQZ7_9CAEN
MDTKDEAHTGQGEWPITWQRLLRSFEDSSESFSLSLFDPFHLKIDRICRRFIRGPGFSAPTGYFHSWDKALVYVCSVVTFLSLTVKDENE